MPTLEKTIFTNLGEAFINDVNFNRNGLANMSTVYSSTDLSGMSDDDIKNMTDVANKEITAPCDIILLDNQDTKVRSVGKNDALKQGVYIRCYATYATDKNGKQFLYAVKVNTKPQYLPAFDGINSNAQSYGFNVKFQQTDNINFTKLSNLTATMMDISNIKDVSESYADSLASSASNQIATKENTTDHNADISKLNNQLSSVDNARFNKGTIDTNTDLNNVTTPGTYWCNFMVPINAPKQFTSGMFPRFKLIVSSPTSGIVHQIILLLDGAGMQGMPSLFARSTYANNQWNTWQSMASDSDLKALSSDFYSKIGLKENISDHNNDINNLRTTISNDVQSKLDKKENISDHQNDVNNINNTLATKVTFNGGNITTGNGTFVPAAIGDVVKDNKDGTINLNGTDYAITKYINGNVDFNSLTSPGRFAINVTGSGNSTNQPLNSGWDYIVDVYPQPNGSINQVARTSGRAGEWYRTRYNNNWAGWQETAFKSDINKVNDTLNTKVTFNGGNITTGYGTFVPAAINEVNAINDRLNDKIVGPNQYRDVFNGNVYDLKDKPAGTYWSTGGISGVPNWTGGWGSVNVIHLNPYDTILIANYGGTLTYNSYLNSSWTGWQQFANNSELVNLQNQVNGVLARQHDIMVNLANIYAGGNLELLQIIAFTNGKMTLTVYSTLYGTAMGSGAYDFKTKVLTLNFGYTINRANGTLVGDYGKGEFMRMDISPLYKYFSGWSMGATNMNLQNNKDDSISVEFSDANKAIYLKPGRTAYGGGFQNNAFSNATIVLNHN